MLAHNAASIDQRTPFGCCELNTPASLESKSRQYSVGRRVAPRCWKRPSSETSVALILVQRLHKAPAKSLVMESSIWNIITGEPLQLAYRSEGRAKQRAQLETEDAQESFDRIRYQLANTTRQKKLKFYQTAYFGTPETREIRRWDFEMHLWWNHTITNLQCRHGTVDCCSSTNLPTPPPPPS